MKALLLLLIAGNAFASGGRSLPTGENDPAVIEKIFSSPRGEVQFVTLQGGHSAFLRSAKGGLAGLKEVRGPSACDSWLISGKNEALPEGCDFWFHDEYDGALFSVRSEEMQEGSLFQAVRGTTRGAIVTF